MKAVDITKNAVTQLPNRRAMNQLGKMGGGSTLDYAKASPLTPNPMAPQPPDPIAPGMIGNLRKGG